MDLKLGHRLHLINVFNFYFKFFFVQGQTKATPARTLLIQRSHSYTVKRRPRIHIHILKSAIYYPAHTCTLKHLKNANNMQKHNTKYHRKTPRPSRLLPARVEGRHPMQWSVSASARRLNIWRCIHLHVQL